MFTWIKRNKEKSYYVPYFYSTSDGDIGFASCTVLIKGSIKNIADINSIRDHLKKEHGYNDVVVVSFEEFHD